MTDVPHLTLVSDEKKLSARRPRPSKRRPGAAPMTLEEAHEVVSELRKKDAAAEHDRLIVCAFMDLEPEISNLSSMARISQSLAIDVGSEEGGDLETKGDLIFASRTLCDMVEQLQQQWHDSHKKANGEAS
jgi:hypothetical protein